MEFNIGQYATLVGYTTDNGKKGYYPTYHIDIDGDYIASEFHGASLTPDDIESIVEDCEDDISYEIARIIARHVVEKAGSRMHKNRNLVRAVLLKQVWDDNDYAVDGEEVEFECSLALDNIDFTDLPDPDTYEEYDYEQMDRVYDEANYLGIVEEWSGPYCCRFYDEDEYRRYYEARKALEQ